MHEIEKWIVVRSVQTRNELKAHVHTVLNIGTIQEKNALNWTVFIAALEGFLAIGRESVLQVIGNKIFLAAEQVIETAC